MITEDYVSFEVAKLLKEKGFDVYGDGSFGSETEIHREYSPSGKMKSLCGSKPHTNGYPAPTLQMAMKYLRKEHNIGIFPSSYTFMDGEGTEKYHPYGTSIVNLVTHNLMTDDIMPRNSYTEAVEAALKYSLENLI